MGPAGSSKYFLFPVLGTIRYKAFTIVPENYHCDEAQAKLCDETTPHTALPVALRSRARKSAEHVIVRFLTLKTVSTMPASEALGALIFFFASMAKVFANCLPHLGSVGVFLSSGNSGIPYELPTFSKSQ
jgi:hypothetical protein